MPFERVDHASSREDGATNLGGDLSRDASRVVRLRADEYDAGLLQLVHEQVHEQEVPEVVHADRLLEPVGRPSRLLVLRTTARQQNDKRKKNKK